MTVEKIACMSNEFDFDLRMRYLTTDNVITAMCNVYCVQ